MVKVSAKWQGIIPGEFYCHDLKSTVPESHLAKRAWIFQERLLAPRMINFTGDQILWECGTILATESLVDGVDVNSLARDSHLKSWHPNWLRLGKPQLEHSGEDWQDDASMREQWRTIVEEYTDCELTFNSDNLIALASISARQCVTRCY